MQRNCASISAIADEEVNDKPTDRIEKLYRQTRLSRQGKKIAPLPGRRSEPPHAPKNSPSKICHHTCTLGRMGEGGGQRLRGGSTNRNDHNALLRSAYDPSTFGSAKRSTKHRSVCPPDEPKHKKHNTHTTHTHTERQGTLQFCSS